MTMKPSLLNLKDKEGLPNPLVEIMGPIDMGKVSLAKLVARRLNCQYIGFPILDPTTLTGRGLLSLLTTEKLETVPEWWAHFYAAHLYEQGERIRKELEVKPVVVTNYIYSYRYWMRNLGIETTSFTTGLPIPNMGYALTGDPIDNSFGTKFNFSPEFTLRQKRTYAKIPHTYIKSINTEDYKSGYPHVMFNAIATLITDDLKRKYKCRVYNEVYTSTMFPKKKDL